MGSLIINVPFRLAFGPRNSLTLCGDLRSQRQSNCPDKSRKALSAAITLRVPPKSYCFKQNGAGGTITLSRISHRCGVCSAPRSVFNNWNQNSSNKERHGEKRVFFTGFAVNSSYMFSCRFVCARECVDFLDFQMWAQHTPAISCPTALFFYAVPPLF